VELVPHMLDQVELKVQKYQSRSQMCLPLKNACETSWCLIVDRWSNDGSDSVIVVIIAVVSLIVDDHIVQDDESMHDQSESVLRVRSGGSRGLLLLHNDHGFIHDARKRHDDLILHFA
jgi:hypothetical protein